MIYRKYIKRVIDIICALAAITFFSWLYIILIIIGAVAMRGNPFFTQLRPGKDEKIFKLIKFRTMDNRRDANGNLLPDDVRLNKYGRFLRKTSLDELPEAFNILVGDMSVVGPRPLMSRYLPFYNNFERKRHSVRPGLTGYAQIKGRNAVNWTDRFVLDIEYVQNISLVWDIKIIFDTILLVLRRQGIENDDMISFDNYRNRQWETGEEEHENTMLRN